jgi:hypothetical protein
MPYGNFKPERKFGGTRPDGSKYSGKTPAGYAGLFRATVTYQNGQPILRSDGTVQYDVPEHFCDEDAENGESYAYSWSCIDRIMFEELEKNFPNTTGTHYHIQYGFGGDDSSGLIDFFTEVQLEIPEPIYFELYGKKYRMTWEYME